jgi:putative acetyltransferase
VLRIRVDDLTDERTRALITAHLSGMHALSPPESVHALDVSALQRPGVTVWSAEIDGRIAGVGALQRLDDERGELKSMRVDAAFLGQGVGRAILRHIMAAAREAGFTSLWLETGSAEEFLPARRLYESEGFVECGPFGAYADDPLSTFMTRPL